MLAISSFLCSYHVDSHFSVIWATAVVLGTAMHGCCASNGCCSCNMRRSPELTLKHVADATTPGNCYLKSTSSPDNTAIVGTAIPGLSQFPWIRYVDSGYPGVMASGAKSSGVWKGPDVPTNAFGKPMPNQ